MSQTTPVLERPEVDSTVPLRIALYFGILMLMIGLAGPWGFIGLPARLVSGILLACAAFQIVSTATQALMTVVGQRRIMTGRLSALAYVAALLPAIVSAEAGGWRSSHVSSRTTFLMAAVLSVVILGQAFAAPPAIFGDTQVSGKAREDSVSALSRLLRHRPLWRAALILFLCNLSPGWGTPLFYYFTGQLRLSSEMFGT
jgi:uncharacterized membrane protein